MVLYQRLRSLRVCLGPVTAISPLPKNGVPVSSTDAFHPLSGTPSVSSVKNYRLTRWVLKDPLHQSPHGASSKTSSLPRIPKNEESGTGHITCSNTFGALAVVDISQNEALGLTDEHLNPYQLYATCLDQATDTASPELVVDVQMVVLQPNNEVEKSTVSVRNVLGNPMHDLARIEGVHEIRSSSVELSINGVDLDLTPNSITKLSCKYPQDTSDQVEEVVDDEDDFYDPTLNALKMSLEANAT
ncbi:hypothetical protein Nepgr_015920 [Nepenthes gracilis]|uniref:Uncharacterized protein n=1 Tax=Nepenthes gracilis TaxID=150966 RepID=A0AAD3SNU4_NEPGR|nr:hypothetical protein Nepgr_015920 [Nepenthes gracilis]